METYQFRLGQGDNISNILQRIENIFTDILLIITNYRFRQESEQNELLSHIIRNYNIAFKYFKDYILHYREYGLSLNQVFDRINFINNNQETHIFIWLNELINRLPMGFYYNDQVILRNYNDELNNLIGQLQLIISREIQPMFL